MKKLLLSILLTACGTDLSQDLNKDDKQLGETTKAEPTTVSVQGYVSSAFELQVDQKKFNDSEDFYSQKMDELQIELKKAGYEGYALDFDANIGLDDLSNGMRVYMAATGNKGFASETNVNSNGQFAFTVPLDAQKYEYNIRAVKRIGLTITPPVGEDGVQGKSIKWCYNFSAELKDFSVDSDSLILNTFTSKLTKYNCSTDSEQGGIHLP